MLRKAAYSSWFEWSAGSSLVFWRWPFFRKEARDGFPLFITEDIKQEGCRVIPSIPLKTLKLRRLYLDKIKRLVQANYLIPGVIKWDIRCFGVPKGDNDIRLVYDGARSGVNKVVYIPTFFVPTSLSLCRILMLNAHQMDEDVGEMFVNYPMLASFRRYCGVKLTRFKEVKDFSDEDWLAWSRLWFGFKPSPHLAVRFLGIALDYARGDPYDSSNPFHWSEAKVNLPCSDNFNPSLPWLCEWNESAQAMSGDFVSFIDDFRITGYSVENCWQCGRRLGSRLQSLGIQEAARERKPPSLAPEA